MNKANQNCMVIYSRVVDGSRFRPSDWVERLSSTLARFGADRRLRYDNKVHPVVIDGEKCLFVSPELEHHDPQLYRHILSFASANRLRIEEEGCHRLAA